MNDISTVEGLAKEIHLSSLLLRLADPDDPDEDRGEIARERKNLEELKGKLREMLSHKSSEELKQFEEFVKQLVA